MSQKFVNILDSQLLNLENIFRLQLQDWRGLSDLP
jgi:hypothetical protein